METYGLWVWLDHWMMFSNQKLGFKQPATCRTVKRQAGDLRSEREPEIWSNEEHGYSNQLGISSNGMVTNNLQMLWNPWTKGSYCSSLQCKVARIRKIQATSRNTSAHKLLIRNHSMLHQPTTLNIKTAAGTKKQTRNVDPQVPCGLETQADEPPKSPRPTKRSHHQARQWQLRSWKKHPTAGSAGSCFSCWLHLQVCLDTWPPGQKNNTSKRRLYPQVGQKSAAEPGATQIQCWKQDLCTHSLMPWIWMIFVHHFLGLLPWVKPWLCLCGGNVPDKSK